MPIELQIRLAKRKFVSSKFTAHREYIRIRIARPAYRLPPTASIARVTRDSWWSARAHGARSFCDSAGGVQHEAGPEAGGLGLVHSYCRSGSGQGAAIEARCCVRSGRRRTHCFTLRFWAEFPAKRLGQACPQAATTDIVIMNIRLANLNMPFALALASAACATAATNSRRS